MPDGYFDSLPIPRKNVNLAGMQQNIANLQSGLAQEILDREAADATKANKSTTINGKSLEADRVIYAQDVPSKNLLPNTATSKTTRGVTFTVNSDGSVTASGTPTGNAVLFVAGSDWYHPATFPLVGGQQYILSGCPSGGASDSYRMAIWEYNGSTDIDYFNDVGNGVTFTANASANGMIVVITIPSGVNTTGMVFRPMIRLASVEDGTYVPYAKTNVGLTKETKEKLRLHQKGDVCSYTRGQLYGFMLGESFYFAINNAASDISAITVTGTMRIYINGRSIDADISTVVVRYNQNNQLSCAVVVVGGGAVEYHPGVLELRDATITFS